MSSVVRAKAAACMGAGGGNEGMKRCTSLLSLLSLSLPGSPL